MKAFYVKCRPQDADILKIVRDYRRVFIGYAPWKKGGLDVFDKHHIRRSIHDLSQVQNPTDESMLDEWLLKLKTKRSYFKAISLNHGFAQEVEPGWYVVVPRPLMGLAFVGRIKNRFELVDDPKWADEYLALRKSLRLEYESDIPGHITDVVQTWEVEKWVSFPFPLIPRWISYSLLSPNTIGMLVDRPDQQGVTAHFILDQIYNGEYEPSLTRTLDPEEVEIRLLDWISPNAFEHLVCQLLQLEDENGFWHHVGGAGDGGADGVHLDRSGCISEIVQCKWKYDYDPIALGKQLLNRMHESWKAARVIVAVLYDSEKPKTPDNDVQLLRRDEVARLLVKHRESCPYAAMLGVG